MREQDTEQWGVRGGVMDHISSTCMALFQKKGFFSVYLDPRNGRKTCRNLTGAPVSVWRFIWAVPQPGWKWKILRWELWLARLGL